MKTMWAVAFLPLFLSSQFVLSEKFSDITSRVNLDVEGVVVAYGDFNNDKTTDVFIATQAWTQLELYTWGLKSQEFKKFNGVTVNVGSSEIVGVMPADFNGDGNLDILVSTKKKGELDFVYVEVFYGDTKKLVKGNLDAKMKDQPTIMDVDGDLYPDLFGTNENDVRSYWMFVPAKSSGSGQSGFHMVPQYSSNVVPESSLIIPNSNAFVDIDDGKSEDFHPELIVKSTHKESGEIVLETWTHSLVTKDEYNFTHTDTVILNIPGVQLYGMTSFADIDGDAKIDVVVPVCFTADCTKSAVYMRKAVDGKLKQSNWTLLVNNDRHDWQFPADSMKNVYSKTPFTLRYGDFNLDNLMDATAVLQRKNKGRLFPAYFLNVACALFKGTGCQGKRTWDIQEILIGSSTQVDHPVIVSFLDVFENGRMDFVITCQNKVDKSKFYVKVFRNSFNEEAAFLKVGVLSGLHSSAKYGAAQIGATVGISTTNTDGDAMVAKAPHLSQSAYFSLQLPYVIFGLGRSPNFVETLTVGLPKGATDVRRVRSWAAIIPNAQVIVIPYPKDSPSDWVTKLLVTPNKVLLQTGGVLIGTCLLIAGIILILHIKEKKEDEQEKRKESHKFHFDAL